MTDIIGDLEWRGLIAQSTDEEALRKTLASGYVTVYCGFDPTASSLHVGSLIQILTLRRLQQAGHRPIALVGGGTGLIGDPSGKSTERVLNPTEIVAEWVDRIGGQLGRFLDFSPGPSGAVLVSNLDWLGQMSAMELLRDIGKHFSVNEMLARDTVRNRLEAGGISYTEFSYVVLQALDYLELYRRYGCTVQTGGSDQWGNLAAGVSLIRRVEGVATHALTTPLLTQADGTKFGKTEAGTVWLDPELTSPYAFYQFWFNAADSDIVRFLKAFSFRSREEVEELEQQTREQPATRAAQRALAVEMTTLAHGERECAKVTAASRALFGRGELGELDERTLSSALTEVPRAQTHGRLPPFVDLFTETGLATSKSAARRAIGEGGAYVNNRRITDVEAVPEEGDLLHGRFLVLRRGKRNVAGVDTADRQHAY